MARTWAYGEGYAPLSLTDSEAVTTGQLDRTLRINRKARQYQAMADAVVTPELRKAMRDYGRQVSETLGLQIKVRNMLPPSLEAMVREQNRRIADMLDSAGIRKALANVEFNLPEEWEEQIAAYRERVASEVTAAEEAEPASGLGWLAEEREAIITCLHRIGHTLEGFAHLPNSPIPPLVGFLILTLAVLGGIADEKLREREEDD